MAISLVQVGGKITAALLNSIIKQVNGTALNGIVPASVAGTGVTVAANGQVTFTNATTVSLNGVFTGTFDNYRITWSTSTRSTSAVVNFRLRQAGNDLTSSTYDWVRTITAASGASATATLSASSSGTAAPLDTGIAAGQVSSGVFDLFGPALSTAMLGAGTASILSASALTAVTTSLANEAAASNDGFTLYPTSGTWSGTVRVYGYNNLV